MVDVATSTLGTAAASYFDSRSRLPNCHMDRQRLPNRVAQQHASTSGASISRITQQTHANGDRLTQSRQRGTTGVTNATAPSLAFLDYWSSPQANSEHQQYHQSHQAYIPGTAEAWRAFAHRNGQFEYTHSSLQALPPAPVIQITSSAAFRPQDSHFSAQKDLLAPYSMSYEPQMDAVPLQHVPVSPVSHHSRGPSRGPSPIPEPLNRKRSFSQLDQQLEQTPNGTSQAYVDDGRPVRVTRTIKRPDAPMNDQHKYICNVTPECNGLTFERKCEWSKHMDKHDRPYTCPHPACAKLQGFTYSGGLLRHEREVHNKHGGPRALLMCPFVDCKRHTDKGFTRRENLQEHLRRVHGGQPEPQPDKAEELDTPASALSGETEDLYAALKPEEKSTAQEVGELRDQLHRLRAENEAKSAVIQRLEEDARLQNDRLVSLEQTLRSMQQQQIV